MHTYTLSPDFLPINAAAAAAAPPPPSTATTATSAAATAATVNPVLERKAKLTAPVIVCATDPTGTLVATGGADGMVKVWDIRKGFVTHNLRGHGGLVSSLAFFVAPPDGAAGETEAHEAATTADGIANDREKRGKGKGKGKGKGAKGKTQSGMGRFMLATGGEDASILVWDLETTTNVATLRSHGSVVRGLDWSPGGRRLLSGGRDGVMCLIDTQTWNAVVTNTGEELEAVGFVAPGGVFRRADGGQVDRLVFAAGRLDRVRIWDLESGLEITRDAKLAGDGDGDGDDDKGVVQVMSVSPHPRVRGADDGWQIPQEPADAAVGAPRLHDADPPSASAIPRARLPTDGQTPHGQLRSDPRSPVPAARLGAHRRGH